MNRFGSGIALTLAAVIVLACIVSASFKPVYARTLESSSDDGVVVLSLVEFLPWSKKDVTEPEEEREHLVIDEFAELVNDWVAYVGYEARQAAKSDMILREIDSVVLQAELEVLLGTPGFEFATMSGFGGDPSDSIDPCTLEIRRGAEALMNHEFVLRATDFGGSFDKMVMTSVDEPDACADRDGFFLEVDDTGVQRSAHLCPMSCERVREAVESNTDVRLEMLIYGS
ncbi:MAG: hypothetical protein AAF219_03825 [Myxococcota bacterium]